MDQLPRLVSGFEKGTPGKSDVSKFLIARALSWLLKSAAIAYYSYHITNNINYQNALRQDYGLGRVESSGQALRLGGYGGQGLDQLRAQQAHVRSVAGIER